MSTEKPIMTGFDPSDDDPDRTIAIRLTPEAVKEIEAAQRPWWRRLLGWMKGDSHDQDLLRE